MTLAEKVKQVSILDFAQRCGYALVRMGHYYSLREHDSVRIDPHRNCFWRNSLYVKGQKGHSGTVIDFALEFCGCRNSGEAIHYIANMYSISANQDYISTGVRAYTSTHTTKQKKTKELKIPKLANSQGNVIQYLCGKRGISRNVVNLFIEKGMLYQDERRNCVFVSPDKSFGCVRSTGEKKFVRDLEGCDYDKCFFYSEFLSPNTIIVTESVIDMMSVMTYAELNKWFINKYKNKCYLALSGTNKITSLNYHINKNPDISEVLLALDKDNAGTAAVSAALKQLSENGYKGSIRFLYPPSGKDWNDCINEKR